MARFEKFKAQSIGRIFLHNNREQGDGVQHSNENIDDERTMFNYYFRRGTPKNLQQRLSEVYSIGRENQTVMAEFIVTLPKDVKSGDERTFFSAVYDFYCNDFGENNIINAVVHNDEITPHIHIDFVPVVTGNVEYGGNKNKALEEWKENHSGELERLCCKDLISRDYLRHMHPRLSEHVRKSLGYEVEILNGATANGNRTVTQLKLASLQEEVERERKVSEHLNEEIMKMHRMAERLGIRENDMGLLPLMAKLDDLENQNEVLREIIKRNGCMYSRDDIERLKAKTFISSEASGVNVYDGSLVGAVIPEDAVVVIELYDTKPRPLPQIDFIKRDEELCRITASALRSPEKIIRSDSKKSRRQYVFIKTDDDRQTAQNLIEMEKCLRETELRNRRLYMDRMETDRYDIARSVLAELEANSYYYTYRDMKTKSEQREAEISRQQ